MWVACGETDNKDWVQIGDLHHIPGKSIVIDEGSYPVWGDDASKVTQ